MRGKLSKFEIHVALQSIRVVAFTSTSYCMRGFRLLPRDARSIKRGIAIVSRPSVRLSVTLMYPGRMCCVSSKVLPE